MNLFKKKQVENNIIEKQIVFANTIDLNNTQATNQYSPSYLAGINILSNELARFNFIITPEGIKNIFANIGNKLVSGEFEAKKMMYEKLLDTGKVAIVFYDKNYILSGDEFTINENKQGEITSINVNGVKVAKDRVLLLNLSDTKDGGFRSWLKDIIELENYYIKFNSFYLKSYGLFGAYKIDTIAERDINIMQSLLFQAKKKLNNGESPVLPASLQVLENKADLQKLDSIKDFIIKTIARVMGIPLLLFQAREGGAYALAKEEATAFYKTTLQGYVELVRAGLEKFLQNAYNSKIKVDVDFSGIDYLSDVKIFSTQEVLQMFNAGIIDLEESRKLLQIDRDLSSIKQVKNDEEVNKQIEIIAPQKFLRALKNIKLTEKQLLQEDEQIWNWHAKKMQPLEKFMTQELLAEYNRTIKNYIRRQQNKGITFEINDDFFDMIDENILKVVKSYWKKAGKRALENELTRQGYDVYLGDDALQKAFEQLQFKSSLTERVYEAIQKLVEEDKEYTADEVAKELQNLFSKADAYTIARTEINRASNFAIRENAKEVEKIANRNNLTVVKRWSTAQDERVRPSHYEAGLVGWINNDEKFPNGLLYPYDETADTDEIINCRCTLLTKLVEKEAEE
jgi:hypothetical protein